MTTTTTTTKATTTAIIAILLSLLLTTTAFVPLHSSHSAALQVTATEPSQETTTTARKTSAKNKKKQPDAEEEALSDVETRVLQSLLQNSSSIDTQTEQGVRELLARGTAPKQVEIRESSEFSSQALQKLAQTKMYQKLSQSAVNVWESMAIWVGNKIEQDVATLAALGLFAWDRAVKDVARALPATSSRSWGSTTQTLQLSETSSFVALEEAETEEETSVSSLRDELKKPKDEIADVSREIRGILSGRQRASQGRNLRSVAPTGTQNAAERQRRAYVQSRKVIQQEEKVDLTKVPGAVVDTSWELRKELTAERNEPGYKTEPVRKAIKEGVANTGNLLRQVQTEARLAAAKRKEARRYLSAESLQEKTKVAPVAKEHVTTAPTVEADRVTEVAPTNIAPIDRDRVVQQLRVCIEEPATSWLASAATVDVSDDSLREILTTMVLLRNDLIEQDVGDDDDLRSRVQDLLVDGDSMLPESMSLALRDTLSFVLVVGEQQEEVTAASTPVPDSTVYVNDDIDDGVVFDTTTGIETEASNAKNNNWFGGLFETTTEAAESTTPPHDPLPTDTSPVAVVDVAEAEIVSTRMDIDTNGANVHDFASPASSFAAPASDDEFTVEVVTDEDFERTFSTGSENEVSKNADAAEEVNEEGDNSALKLFLRGTDVVFFLLEKVFVIGLPRGIKAVTTAAGRFQTANRAKYGQEGWSPYEKLDHGRGRY